MPSTVRWWRQMAAGSLFSGSASWLAVDFDAQAAMLDALTYLKAARAVGARALLEVSRSGIGANVWIFFADPVPAATTRQLGTALVREVIANRGRMEMRCYDRFLPFQDVLPAQGPGTLIEALLHDRSRRVGTTDFSTWPRWSRSRTSGGTSPLWNS